MANYALKTGDVLPSLQVQLLDPNGDAVNLTGLTIAVNWSIDDDVQTPKSASILGDPTAGTIEITWSAGETDTAGLVSMEFELDDGRTFPPDGFYDFRIYEDLE